MKITGILKPEYFYQPRVALQRLLPFKALSSDEFIHQLLPWGLSIRIRPREEHGRIVCTLGVIDLVVTETLWRLADPGELAVDVGANIGYMTSILAARVGSIAGGSVRAFEAHPEIFQELKYNVEQWRVQLPLSQIEIQQVAVSEHRGTVTLGVPESFTTNRGLSSIVNLETNSNQSTLTDFKTLAVESVSLDNLFPTSEKIGVLKLDVEGHEISVLKGAKNLLSQKRVRDFIFEEHREYPTSVTKYFEEIGYTVFRIQRKFFGPALLPPDSKVPRTRWEPTSFLATKHPQRAIGRFKESGWKSLIR